MEAHRVGRNNPCPCGSRKKFKHCCLRVDPGSGVRQPLFPSGDGVALRRTPGVNGTAIAPRPKPVTQRVSVEYTIRDAMGVAEVTYAFPVGLPVILINGYVLRAERLKPGMQFLLEGGGQASVTAVGQPKDCEPPSTARDGHGNSLRRVIGTFKYTGWVPLVEVTYGGATHKITPGHRYWSETRRGWYPIGTFRPGELLRTPEENKGDADRLFDIGRFER